MKFDYSPLPSVKSKIVLAPIVPITFTHKKFEFSTFALVDSGAAGAVISTVIADALNIKWDKIPVSIGYTLSGQFRSHLLENIEATIKNQSFALEINIVEAISPYHCILGRKDLFQKAKIVFEGYDKRFEIIFRQYN